MVNIFNRKRLTAFFSAEKLAEVEGKLAELEIESYVKTVDRMNPSPFSAGMRARTGGFGQNAANSLEYIIYVRKIDYEKAVSALRAK